MFGTKSAATSPPSTSCSSPLNLVVTDSVFDFSTISTTSSCHSSLEDAQKSQHDSSDENPPHNPQIYTPIFDDQNPSMQMRYPNHPVSFAQNLELGESSDSAIYSSSNSVSASALESPILSSHLESHLLPNGEFVSHDSKAGPSQNDGVPVHVNSYYGSPQIYGTGPGSYPQFMPLPPNAATHYFPLNNFQPYPTMYPPFTASTPTTSRRSTHYYHPYQYAMPAPVYTPTHLLPSGSWVVSPVGSRPNGLIMGSDYPVMNSSSPLMNGPNTPDGINMPMTGELFDQVENAGIALPDSQGRTSSKSQHMCNYCGKLYSRRYGLKIHLRTHSGYKPLKCSYCPRTFSDPSNLNKHTKLHFNHDTTKHGMRKVPRLSAPPDEDLLGLESESIESFAPLPQSSPDASGKYVNNNMPPVSTSQVRQSDLEEADVVIDDLEERGANVPYELKGRFKIADRHVEHEESSDGPAEGIKNSQDTFSISSQVEKTTSISNLFSAGFNRQYIETDYEGFTSPAEQFQELPETAEDDGSSYASLISYEPPSDVPKSEIEHVFHKEEPSNIYVSSTQDFQYQEDSNGTSFYDGGADTPWFFDENSTFGGFVNLNASSVDIQNCLHGFHNSGQLLDNYPYKGGQAMIAQMPTTLSDSGAVMASSVDDYHENFLLPNQTSDFLSNQSHYHDLLSNQTSDDIFQVEKDAIDDCVDFAGLLLPPPSVEQDSQYPTTTVTTLYTVNNDEEVSDT